MDAKTVSPSPSYSLRLPADVHEEQDGTVSSFWLEGTQLLLQLSSYLRREGIQVGARERLAERISKDRRKWKISREPIHPNPAIDQSSAVSIADDGIVWLYSYLVWPHLAIYATICGPKDLVTDRGNWALRALQTISLTTN